MILNPLTTDDECICHATLIWQWRRKGYLVGGLNFSSVGERYCALAHSKTF